MEFKATQGAEATVENGRASAGLGHTPRRPDAARADPAERRANGGGAEREQPETMRSDQMR